MPQPVKDNVENRHDCEYEYVERRTIPLIRTQGKPVSIGEDSFIDQLPEISSSAKVKKRCDDVCKKEEERRQE